MPRPMPGLAREFELKVLVAVALSNKIEQARNRLKGVRDRSLLHPERIELVYEMSFFRYYLAWEEFLEESFVRYMAGYPSVIYVPTRVRGINNPSVSSARVELLGGRPFKLWHDPAIVSARSAKFLVSGPHEVVINSAISELQSYSRIRHRIAHAQLNAKANFDSTCVTLIGSPVKGSKPGKLLRSQYVDPNGHALRPGFTWLHQIAETYVRLARQIA